jgi:transposase
MSACDPTDRPAAPQGRLKGKGKLDLHLGFFVKIIEQDGDITMPELSAALFDPTRVRVHPNAIGKSLCKLGYTYKLVTGHPRTPPCQSKTTAQRLVRTPHSRDAEASGARCLY